MTTGNGDDRFRELYQQFYWRVVRYYVRAFRLSEEDAKDLAQDAFVRFLNAVENYRGDAGWAYMERIARNVAFNRIRSLNASKRFGEHVGLDDPKMPTTQQPDHAERQQETLKRRQLQDAMEGLSPARRRCLQLWLSDLSYDEIAAALGASVESVKAKLKEAKKFLRKELADDLADDLAGVRLPEVEE
jgi:RNA polymerase sigma-70 factor (ECF subfamily)